MLRLWFDPCHVQLRRVPGERPARDPCDGATHFGQRVFLRCAAGNARLSPLFAEGPKGDQAGHFLHHRHIAERRRGVYGGNKRSKAKQGKSWSDRE